MKRPFAYAARAAILAIAAALSLLATGCSSGTAEQEDPEEAAQAPPPPETILNDLVLDRVDSGRLNQRILAARATYRETSGQQYAWLENVKVEFYSYEGEDSMPGLGGSDKGAGAGAKPARNPRAKRRLAGSLWANAAALYLDTFTTDSVKLLLEERSYADVQATAANPNNMDLVGDVQYRVEKEDGSNGDSVLTRHLRWDSKEVWDGDEGVLRGHGWFRIIRPAKEAGAAALLIEGEGFQSNRDMQRWIYTRTQIKSERLTPEALAALMPQPRTDAPSYAEPTE